MTVYSGKNNPFFSFSNKCVFDAGTLSLRYVMKKFFQVVAEKSWGKNETKMYLLKGTARSPQTFFVKEDIIFKKHCWKSSVENCGAHKCLVWFIAFRFKIKP